MSSTSLKRHPSIDCGVPSPSPDFLQVGSEGVDPKDLIGVSEEVVAFVRDFAMHPEMHRCIYSPSSF